jgi:DNA-binding transcriptional LysR family regulator
MSNALSRLRDCFGDPLLVRNGRAMMLTAKGQQLLPAVRDAVVRVQSLLGDEEQFVPRRSNHSFCLATTDYWEFLYLPQLMSNFHRDAPGMTIEIKRLVSGQYEPPLAELRSGEFDIAIGFFPELPATSAEFHRQQLCSDQLVSIVRTGGRSTKGKLTLKTYLQLGHIATKYRESGGVFTVDAALEAIGRRRVSTLTVPHYFIAPYVVAQTDLIGNLPGKMAHRFASLVPIRVVKPPVNARRLDTVMLWHDRAHSDAAHAWLRSLLLRCSQ